MIFAPCQKDNPMMGAYIIKETRRYNEDSILNKITNVPRKENKFFSCGARNVNIIFGIENNENEQENIFSL